jgi:hypothetical protein
LFESARILADLAFGAFTERLIVQLDIESTPIDGSNNRIEPLNQ